MSHPANAIRVEGRTLGEAVQIAAGRLGVDSAAVEHRIDVSHFRTPEGASRGADTVCIFAWTRDPGEIAGAVAAREWLAGLVERMGISAEVGMRATGAGSAVVVINSAEARHLVGRQGITLRAIEALLRETLSRRFPDWNIQIDIQGGGAPEERRERRGREDRGPSADGPRPRRDGRRDGRREGRRSDDRAQEGGDERRSERDVEKLRQLARRLASEALETGQPVQIRRQLNSFERRVVHMAVAEMQGVVTESVGEGPQRNVVIRAADDPRD